MDSQNTDSPGQARLSLTAGSRLRSAREAAGLTRADISSQTKIAERHLCAIEEDRFGDLAARTYAVGFARAYARALGLDEADMAAAVHAQIDVQNTDSSEAVSTFEPGDPARVPPVRLAWLAAAGAVAVIALLLVFWSSFLSPEGKLPDLLPEKTPAPVARAPVPARVAPAPADGPVVLTATADGVPVNVTDGTGKVLFDKTLAKGESWTVPAGAPAPQLRSNRPDALQVSVGGRPVPPLASRPGMVSGLSLDGAGLLARNAALPVQAVSPSASPTAEAAPTPLGTAAPARSSRPSPARPDAGRTAAPARSGGTSQPASAAPPSPAAAANTAPAPAAPQPERTAAPLSTVSE